VQQLHRPWAPSLTLSATCGGCPVAGGGGGGGDGEGKFDVSKLRKLAASNPSAERAAAALERTIAGGDERVKKVMADERVQTILASGAQMLNKDMTMAERLELLKTTGANLLEA
jgi:hypothetical protein